MSDTPHSPTPPDCNKPDPKPWPIFYVILAILGYMLFQMVYIWWKGG